MTAVRTSGLLFVGLFLHGLAASAADERLIRFTESRAVIANPERGFYAPRMSHRMTGLEGLRARGITLLLVEADFREFKDVDLSPAKLDELRNAFAAARRNGLKVIFRAAYGYTNRDYRADPKDLTRITGHIAQLKPIFESERDVLAAVQAGLLGPWGEWHGSNHGDPPSLEARRAVLFGLLDAVPAPIPVQIRRPMFIRDIFANEPGGSTLTPETAFGKTRLSRVGWHDDAMLSLPTDMGTFAEPGWNRERELRWCDDHGRFAPFGGETVPPSARTPFPQVVRELSLLHATYLNSAYHRGTLEGWSKASIDGEDGLRHVERRLGHRLVADRLTIPKSTAPGGTMRIELELKNVGFAAPCLPREASFVLADGKTSQRIVATAPDIRLWAPGSVVRLTADFKPPAETARGPRRLSLHVPDPSPRLRDDGRYAVRLANDDIKFSEENGLNVLVEDVEIR